MRREAWIEPAGDGGDTYCDGCGELAGKPFFGVRNLDGPLTRLCEPCTREVASQYLDLVRARERLAELDDREPSRKPTAEGRIGGRASDGTDVHPAELVRGVESFLKNQTAWRGVRALVARCYFKHDDDGYYDAASYSPRFDEELCAAALERANNIVSWLVTEYEIKRRET